MIISFRHKGLEAFFKTGSTQDIQSAQAKRLRLMLSLLDGADQPKAMDLPGFKLHKLKDDLAVHYSVLGYGNWRLTFRFTDQDVELVDYQDNH